MVVWPAAQQDLSRYRRRESWQLSAPGDPESRRQDKSGRRRQGDSLRVGGEFGSPEEGLVGDRSWKRMQIEFRVWAPTEEIELICELRATQGDAWFDLQSLRLVQVP